MEYNRGARGNSGKGFKADFDLFSVNDLVYFMFSS